MCNTNTTKLQATVTNMESLASLQLRRIAAMARLTRYALQSPAFNGGTEDVATTLDAMHAAADELADMLQEMAHEVGCVRQPSTTDQGGA